MSQDSDVLIRREGRAGRITMNRPKALNALTYPMVGEIERALLAWQADQAVDLVILDGAGERGLCAGGDVRSLYDARTEGSGFARTFWRDEYRLNTLIHRYKNAVRSDHGRHRHGRRHRPFRARQPSHRHREKHAGDAGDHRSG